MQNAHAARDLTNEGQRVALGYILPGPCPLQRQARFGDISQISHRIHIGDGLGEAIAAMEAEPMSEALFHLKGPTVINRGAAADFDEEITQLREQSKASACWRSVPHHRLAGFAGDDCSRRW